MGQAREKLKSKPATTDVVFPIPAPIVMGVNVITAADFASHIIDTNTDRLRRNWDEICACVNIRNALMGEPGTLSKPIPRKDFAHFVSVLISPGPQGYDMLFETRPVVKDGQQVMQNGVPIVERGKAVPFPADELHRMIGAFVSATAPEETK